MSRMSVLGTSLSAAKASSAIGKLPVDTSCIISNVGGHDQHCASSSFLSSSSSAQQSSSSLPLLMDDVVKIDSRSSPLDDFMILDDIWPENNHNSNNSSSGSDGSCSSSDDGSSEGEGEDFFGSGVFFAANPVSHFQGFYPRHSSLPQLGQQLSDVNSSDDSLYSSSMMFDCASSSSSSSLSPVSSVSSPSTFSSSSPVMSPAGGFGSGVEITANLNSASNVIMDDEDEAQNELIHACNSALDAKTMMMIMHPTLPELPLSDIDAILSSSVSVVQTPSSSLSSSATVPVMSPIASSPSSYIMIKNEPVEAVVFKSEPCSPASPSSMYSSSSPMMSPISSPESSGSDYPASPSSSNLKRYPNKTKKTTSKLSNHDDNKHPVRKTKDCLHVAEFLLSLLLSPEKYGKLIKWERKETGLFRILKPNEVANLWARTKSNKEHMDYPNMARGIRFAREKSGDFDLVTKEDGVGKKLVYKFSQRFRARNDHLQKIMSPFDVRRKIKKEELF